MPKKRRKNGSRSIGFWSSGLFCSTAMLTTAGVTFSRIGASVGRPARAVALVAVAQDLEIERRIRTVGHGPEKRIGVVRVDVVVHGDDVLARGAVPGGGAVEGAPDLGPRHVALEDQHHHLAQVGER